MHILKRTAVIAATFQETILVYDIPLYISNHYTLFFAKAFQTIELLCT